MATAANVLRLTYDDLEFIPRAREGDRHELFDGVLVVTASPAPPHQRVSRRLMLRGGNHVEGNDLGEVFAAPIDVVFAPAVVAVPDLVFVRRDNLGIVGRTAIEGASDLIIEILSPSTRRRDLRTKKALYARFGVPEYWTVDLRRRNVTVCDLVGGRYECRPHVDGVARSTVVTGLAVDLVELFTGI